MDWGLYCGVYSRCLDVLNLKRKFKWLKCSECDTLLERMYTNEQLDKLYPVDDSWKIGNVQNDNNMKLYLYGKKLWKCPKCGKSKELSVIETIRMATDFKIGRSIEYE